MESDMVIRDEPGEYRVTARCSPDGTFAVFGESSGPLTLTVRVEDVWSRLPERMRRRSYAVSVWRDGADAPSHVLEDVAPDARIFLDFGKTFRMDFR